MVVSVEANATKAGVEMLERGGNAIDAAVAVGYALAVTHPSAGNVGGGGFLLARTEDEGTIAVDFRERAPSGLTRAAFDAMIRRHAIGPAASGVPGTVAGLNLAHREHGRLPLAAVLAPAIRLAERGHRVGRREALTFAWNWRRLRRDPAARALFGDPRGGPRRAGTLLTRPDLARTLRAIADHGDAGFYSGRVARQITGARGSRGLITMRDLQEYRARLREPLRVAYHGFEVSVMPPPSAGGVAVVGMLLMLDRLGAHRLAWGSAAELHLFLEASKRAHAERRFGVVDPDALDGAERRARRARWLNPATWMEMGPPVDRARATPAERIHPLYGAAMRELAHTTHFATADTWGNVVSCTTTLSAGFGAAYVVPGTGIVMNNSLAAFGTAGDDLPHPGRRMTSSMAPVLVASGTSSILALGSPGGDTIASTVVQVLRNVVDHGMALDEAVDAPRIHHGFVPDEVRYERARPPSRAVLDGLRAMGHRFSKKRIPIGDANSLLIADGAFWGYADPREGGLALAPRRSARQ